MKLSSISTLLLFSIATISCTAKTEPIDYGKDNCYFCKMGIVDPKFGGEVVTKKTKVYKFDDVICMVHFLQTGTIAENEIAKKVVINYEKENEFIEVDKAIFLASPDLRSPMGSNAASFSSKDAAEKIKTGEGLLLTWMDLYKKIK